MDIVLRGMTWSHPRGYDPLVACSKLWREATGVEVQWDKRSLQDFEAYPIEELARRYDLIVIDHPHVGQVTREGCLKPFDDPARAAEREALERASVGSSSASYLWQGRQWALPIDAATQVTAWRPDLIDAPPRLWSDALDFARNGAALCPMRPPHSLMILYTLTGNLGRPCVVEGPDLVDAGAGAEAYERMRELTALLDSRCFAFDPIDVFEAMAAPESRIACAPLIYGYVSYSHERLSPAPHHVRGHSCDRSRRTGRIGPRRDGHRSLGTEHAERSGLQLRLLGRGRRGSGGTLRCLRRTAGPRGSLGGGRG